MNHATTIVRVLLAILGLGGAESPASANSSQTLFPILKVTSNLPSGYAGTLQAVEGQSGKIDFFQYDDSTGQIKTFDFAEILAPSSIAPVHVIGLDKVERLAKRPLLAISSHDLDPICGGRVTLVFARNFPFDFRVVEFDIRRAHRGEQFLVTTVDAKKDAVFNKMALSVNLIPGFSAGVTQMALLQDFGMPKVKPLVVRVYNPKSLPKP